MIQFILGKRGTGKTKFLINRINDAVKQSVGNVVVIDKGDVLRYDVDYKARLINVDDYGIHGFDMFYGFVAGLFAGNYDITEVFIDATFKIGGYDRDAFADMVRRVSKLAEQSGAVVCFTVSGEETDVPEDLREYIVERITA